MNLTENSEWGAAAIALCYCLSARPETLDSEKIERLSREEWEAVFQLALRYGVAPLLYSHVTSYIPGVAIPGEIRQQLHTHYLLSAAANIRLYHELSQILEILDTNNIPVITLKGAHLAEQIYQNIALRPMGDVDLMVEKEALPHVERLLLHIGYTPLRACCFEAVGEISRHLPRFLKEGRTGVEIHWTLNEPTSPFQIDIEKCWERAHSAIIAGQHVLTLAPEDLLLHLSLHIAFQHRFTLGVKGMCDISAALCYYGDAIVWKRLEERALQWGLGKCLYLVLSFSKELLNADVPDAVLHRLLPNDMTSCLRAFVWEQIVSCHESSLPISRNLTRTRRAEGIKDKVKRLLSAVFLSADRMATVYPTSYHSPFLYLYYLRRVKELLLKYGPTLWRLFRREPDIMRSFALEAHADILAEWMTAAESETTNDREADLELELNSEDI